MFFFLLLIMVAASCGSDKDQADKTRIPGTSSDGENRLQWFKDAKFGMIIHWGPYSALGGEWNGHKVAAGSNAEWIMKDFTIPVREYRELARKMNPEKFNASEWVRLAKATGMKYIIITAKHHDGFAMYHSGVTKYNIVDWTTFHRDPLKELSDACAEQGIKFCVYYSHREDWDHPGGYGNDWDYDNDWGNDAYQDEQFNRYLEEKAKPQLKELLTNYGRLGIVWFDRGMFTEEQGLEFVKIVRDLQPDCLINSRVGNYNQDLLGDYQSMSDNGVPPGGLGEYWESVQTLNRTWGYNKFDTLWKSSETVIRKLVEIVSRGGNYALNIGPTGEGEIPEETIKILHEVGAWVQRNAESIYGTHANPFDESTWRYASIKGNKIYLFVKDWPKDGQLTVSGLRNQIKKAYLPIDKSIQLSVHQHGELTTVELPPNPPDTPVSVVVLESDGIPSIHPSIAVQNKTGIIKLDYSTVTTQGKTKTRYNRKGGFHISKWTGPQDIATWTIQIDTPGTFKVNISYSAKKDWENTPYEISIGSSSLHPMIAYTGKLFEYRELPAGYVNFQEPGRYILSVRPLLSNDSYLMYLNSITLLPVKREKQQGWGVN